MRLNTIEKLCCPFDKSDLTLRIITKEDTDNIKEGILSCAHCKRVYPIVSGVPIMNPDEFRDFEREAPMLEKWEQHLVDNHADTFKISEGKIIAIAP
ncbi:Trm112 family protein [Winogradskyella vidalii]|uniref:Trm112 family protein n=1 Tax=Winogradskyella vidalii TaxID=2615024 RepID=UPI0015C717A3|nr:Trm112 family protein [Winogradskyella vidalii]